MDLDVALIHVSVPDRHGYCLLGVSIEATLAAIDNANYLIAKVNTQILRTHGAGIIHVSEIDCFVESNQALPTHHIAEPSDIDSKIEDFVANLIDDKSTLQKGIGSIPNAVLTRLTNHKDFGLRTEMFSDGVIDLILNDVINENFKGIKR